MNLAWFQRTTFFHKVQICISMSSELTERLFTTYFGSPEYTGPKTGVFCKFNDNVEWLGNIKWSIFFSYDDTDFFLS